VHIPHRSSAYIWGGEGDQMGGGISSLDHLIVHVHTFPKLLIHVKGKHIESTEGAKNGCTTMDMMWVWFIDKDFSCKTSFWGKVYHVQYSTGLVIEKFRTSLIEKIKHIHWD
jgi:hypothetical protein